MLTFKKETITPAKASKMLAATDKAGFINRSLTPSFVARYAGDMDKGHWESDTGETIKVTADGVVIDGQHRLKAIAQSGVTTKMWVCRGIDANMFKYIDQGKSRDLKDIMTIKGWENAPILAVSAKMLWRSDRDKNGNPFAHAGAFNESDGNIYNWILTVEPDLRLEWRSYKTVIRSIYNNNMKAIPESLMFYLLYQWKKVDVDAALLFAGYLSEGMGEAPHYAMECFAKYAVEIKMAKLAGTLNARGRHADLKELILHAADYAWDCVINGKQVRTYNGFKTGLGKSNAKMLAEEESLAA
jgi:hypothetical protein